MRCERVPTLATVALAAVVWTHACGDGGTEPPPPDPPRPTTVTVTPSAAELAALEATVQLAAEVRDQFGNVMANASVSWSSSDDAVVVVDGSGLVTAAANGAATITATSGEASATASLTVAQVVAAVTVTPEADTLVEADTLRFSAQAADANGHAVEATEFAWSSADTLVAAVDDSGLVTGVAPGVAEVTATFSGVSGAAALTVAAAVPTTIAVTPETVAFTAIGQTEQLAAEVRDQIGRVMEDAVVSWSSGDTAVAVVDAAGVVTAGHRGTVTITATAGDAFATATVTVTQVAGSVVVSPAADTISIGDTLALAAEAFDANGHLVDGASFEWSSSDGVVATVGGGGMVQGAGEGTATITATAGDARGTSEITVENPDRAVLVALYDATDGPNWVNSEGWLTDAPLGDWYGVDTDRAGRVARIALSGEWDAEAQRWVPQGLKGTIPPELGDLANLELLSLGDKLTGPIPPELGNLAHLTQLWLGRNDLTGPIPPELGNLAKLEWLTLGGNDLTGPIPAELGNLAHLRELWLGDNSLTGPIPPELRNLASLETLSLVRNRLTLLATPLDGLLNLKALYLSHNNLASLPAGAFQDLSSLRELWLNGNRLDSLPPAIFSGLSSLEELRLDGNPGAPFTLALEIRRMDSEDLMAPSPATVGVHLAEGAPFAISVPLSVQGGTLSADTAVVETGGVAGEPVTVTRDSASAARTLVVAGSAPEVPDGITGIRIVPPSEPLLLFPRTAPVVFLESVASASPEGGTAVVVVGVDPAPDAPLTLAYSLGVDEDGSTDDAEQDDHGGGSGGTVQVASGADSAIIEIEITDDDDLEPTREVFTVTLAEPAEETGYVRGVPHTAAVTIEEGVCDRTPPVRDEIVARAGGGDCSGIDDKDLAAIIELDIRGEVAPASGILWTRDLAARIRRGECEPGTWGAGEVGTETTGSIICEGERIDAARAPRGFANGSGGGSTVLQEGDFAGLSNLGVLYLLRLGLTELPPEVFAGLTNLNWLSLQFNALTSLPAGVFSDLTSLWQGLILADNRLASFPETVFAGLFPDPETSGLPERGLLILENNELTRVPPGAFAGLTGVNWLFLNGNRLTDLPPNLFSDLSRMTFLNLENNRLSAVANGLFAGLSGMPTLSLSFNRLTSVPTAAFQDLAGLQRLNLAGNQIGDLVRGGFSSVPRLTRLVLEGNPLGTLEASDLLGVPDLEELYLRSVDLAELAPEVFSDTERLEVLDLRYNRLDELPAGAFSGLTGMKKLQLAGNPGSPFALTLEPVRMDTDDLLAPGPATVAVALREGAPFTIGIPLSVHGGDASAGRVTLGAGTGLSAAVTVTRSDGSQTGTQVVAGPAPALPNGVDGIELHVADPLVLFDTVSNHAPVPVRTLPWMRLRVGGSAGALDVSSYFRDPDGDDLKYTALPDRPEIASAEVSGTLVTVTPLSAGSATVTVTATDPDGLSARSVLPVGVRGASPGLYDIDLFLVDEVTESIRAAFDDAVVYWSSILAGTELPDVPMNNDLELGCWDITTQETLGTVDDLVIVASVREIDGPYGVLASAGFCGIRDGAGGLPFMGAMQFDVDDLERLEEQGDMEEVILHEMGHVLGIGTAWRRFGLLVNPSLPGNQGADTHFAGPLTIEAFDSAGGTEYGGGEKVPVENVAGPGSGDAHWRESVLDHELMTPYQNGGIPDPLSAITIQSLADLGYVVNVSVAEPYRLPGVAADVVGRANRIPYGDDILRGPIIVVDPGGRVVRVIPGAAN